MSNEAADKMVIFRFVDDDKIKASVVGTVNDAEMMKLLAYVIGAVIAALEDYPKALDLLRGLLVLYVDEIDKGVKDE